MTLSEVKHLDRVATASGYTVTDYRPYRYEEHGRLLMRFMLIIDLGEGDEVAVMSEANFEIRRFDRIFD